MNRGGTVHNWQDKVGWLLAEFYNEKLNGLARGQGREKREDREENEKQFK